MTAPARNGDEQAMAVPPIADLRAREWAAARGLDAIAAALRGPKARSAWSRIHPGPWLGSR
jgi:hypothetical protein